MKVLIPVIAVLAGICFADLLGWAIAGLLHGVVDPEAPAMGAIFMFMLIALAFALSNRWSIRV